MSEKISPKNDVKNLILVNPIKISALALVIGPYRYFVDFFSQFLKLAASYSIILGVISLLFGFNYICSLSGGLVDINCSRSSVLYIIYLILRIFITVCFIVQFQRVINGTPINWKKAFLPGKTELKTFGIIGALLLLLVFPLLSFYILYVRVPNPDWRVEIAFFGVVSTGFLVPLFGVRFYSAVSFVALGEKIPDLRLIWRKTSGNTAKILFSLFLMLLFFVFIFINLLSGFKNWETGNIYYLAFASEFIYNLVFLMFISWLTGMCYLQRNVLFGESVNE